MIATQIKPNQVEGLEKLQRQVFALRVQITALTLAFGAAIGWFVLAPAVAHADGNDPTCNFSHTCSWSRWNGQLQPTWEMPGRYGTTDPILCDPVSYTCHIWTPNP